MWPMGLWVLASVNDTWFIVTEVMIGQLTVSVSAGDLTEQKVDAIVNSTNLDLDFTQGKHNIYYKEHLLQGIPTFITCSADAQIE